MKVIHFSQFSAPYKGSFIASLEALEAYDKTIDYVYCFPRNCENQVWIKEFCAKRKVYFTDDDVKKSVNSIIDIINIEKPDVLHSHFDGYDIPISKAHKIISKNSENQIVKIWHLRNAKSYMKEFPKKLYQFFYFKVWYSYFGRKVNIIAVNDANLDFINKIFDRRKTSFLTEVIPNGIDSKKIRYKAFSKPKHDNAFVFGAFGGRNKDKRIDLLVMAAKSLIEEGYNINLRITKGVDTVQVVNSILKNEVPDWLILLDQFQDVNEFYTQCHCFVSTSKYETFSNAVAEATFFGLPIVQSNIQGTQWNAKNPSVFVFKSLNVEDLILKMKAVLETGENEMTKACIATRNSNIAKFDIEIWCHLILRFYHKSGDLIDMQ